MIIIIIIHSLEFNIIVYFKKASNQVSSVLLHCYIYLIIHGSF